MKNKIHEQYFFISLLKIICSQGESELRRIIATKYILMYLNTTY